MMRGLLLAMALTCLGLPAAAAAAAADLVIWWNAGALDTEDERFAQIVRSYEAETGQTVDLTFLATQEMPAKVEAAIEAGTPPDLAMGYLFDLGYTPRWAHEGLLVDVGDVIEAIGAGKFDDLALQSVRLENGSTGARAFYAFPTQQQTVHIHYWAPLLEAAGFTRNDIPSGWSAFWAFWCEEVQPAARDATGNRRLYGIGQPMAATASETDVLLLHFLSAHGGRVLSDAGEMVLDQPRNRRALIRALTEYTTTYIGGCTPPPAVVWEDLGNDGAFLNQKTLMAPNASLAIPASLLETDEAAYRRDLMTRPWPEAPGGGPIPYLTSVKTAVIFAGAQQIDNAKRFMAYLLRPGITGRYLEGGRGRWYPVMSDVRARAFWAGTEDPHRSALVQQYTQRAMLPFPSILNWRYATAQAERVLARGAGRVLLEGETPEEAADWVIRRVDAIIAGAD